MNKNQSGLMNSSRYSPSLNSLPVINTNSININNNNASGINSNNNKNASSLNNIGSMMGDSLYNDVYNKIKEGRKKRILIFG
jgi:hypothetical protein